MMDAGRLGGGYRVMCLVVGWRLCSTCGYSVFRRLNPINRMMMDGRI